MDTFARALEIAHDIRTKSNFLDMKKKRYSSFDTGKGAEYEAGRFGLENLRDIAAAAGEPALESGKQELLENIINKYMF